jgi:hypothetical protein
MPLTTLQEKQLNNMNAASQRAQLGTVIKVLQDGGAGVEIPEQIQALEDAYGRHVVTEGEATLGEAEIDTGSEEATVFIVQIYRAGVNVMDDAVVTLASGVLGVADGGDNYELTEGDVINYIVF